MRQPSIFNVTTMNFAPMRTCPNPKWVSPGQIVKIGDHEVPGPIYVREDFTADPPGFAIDPRLPVADRPPGTFPTGDNALHYKNYSPQQRAALLKRLAGQRSSVGGEDFTNLFCQFLFWHLEWRILVEEDNGTEVRLALANLISQHPEATRVTGLAQSANRLVHLIGERQGKSAHVGLIQWLIRVPNLVWGHEEVGLMLNALEQLKIPVMPEMAILVCRTLAEPSERERIDAFSNEFRARFVQMFNAQNPKGFRVQRPRDTISLCYYPLHWDTRMAVVVRKLAVPFDIPDFFKAPTQFDGFMGICRSVLADLEKDAASSIPAPFAEPAKSTLSTLGNGSPFDEVVVRAGKI